MRLKLTVGYHGPAFAGWQSQKGGGSVQDVMEAAVASIAGQPIRVHGAGRTDAGVHAVGQCCHLDVPDTRMTPSNWLMALNSKLPPTLRVLRAAKSSPDFHARFSAKGKIYQYLIYQGPVLPPQEYQRAWLVRGALDVAKMTECARAFLGTHDFRGFSANRGERLADTCRTIQRVRVSKRGPRITFTVQGEGFLYKMVRMMASAVVQCGLGEGTCEDVQACLSGEERRWTRVAPADGLTLVKVLYGVK
jgi:tRNA pseudouridine38-40 synthase